MLKMAIAEIRYLYLYFIPGHLLCLGFCITYLMLKEPDWAVLFPATMQFALFPLLIAWKVNKKKKQISFFAQLPVTPVKQALARFAPLAIYVIVNSSLLILVVLFFAPESLNVMVLNHVFFQAFQILVFLILVNIYRDYFVGARNNFEKVLISIPYVIFFWIIVFGNGALDEFTDFKFGVIQAAIMSFGWVLPLTIVVAAMMLSLYTFKNRENYIEE